MELTPIFEQLYQETLDSGVADPLVDLEQAPAEQVSPVPDQILEEDQTIEEDQALEEDQTLEEEEGAQLEDADAQPTSPAAGWVVPEERVA